MGGIASNSGELNPVQWNWRAPETYLMMFAGGVIGAAVGYGIMVPGTLSLSIGVNISTPWLSVGVGVTDIVATGAMADWKFQWSTSAGGGGEVPMKKEEKQVKEPKPKKISKDSRFYNGSYYEAAQLLSYVSQRDGVERMMYETELGYYIDEANGYAFADFSKASGLQVNYNYWGKRENGRPIYYVESTINGTYPFSILQQKQNLYLCLNMGERFKIRGVYHTHPNNLPLSFQDAFQNIPGVRVKAIGWDGISRGNYEEEDFNINLLEFIVIPNFK